MKRILLTLILILICTLICTAPERRGLCILESVAVKPLEDVWCAVCEVESKNDPLAYNMREQACGVGQVRPIRLKDFNQHTGKHYTMKDMFDPVKNKEVFMFYAYLLGHDNVDLIIRKWNGSGKQTYEYLRKVKAALRKT